MTLASDGLAHLAPPALAWHLPSTFTPCSAVLGRRVRGAVTIRALKHMTHIPTETVIGAHGGPLLHVESGTLTITIAAGFFLRTLTLRRAT